ncbi:hypothetical protein F8M41_003006 [Gigaspora margarita]|uniref:Uncharacterized protein n=1 Tax=Gigaspora margarita TaxID=4874 RepID=A0A8H4A6V4_GIGMA|nr:hypothetical protein F8M41_003006 [Gigaspora margarita]
MTQNDSDEQQIFEQYLKQYIQCIQDQDTLDKQLETLLESLNKSPLFEILKSKLLELQKKESIHSESYKLISKLQQLQQHVQQSFDSPSLNIQEFLQQQLILLKIIREVTAGYQKILEPYSHKKKQDFMSTLDQLQNNVQDFRECLQKLLQFLQFLQNKQDKLQESVKEYIVWLYVEFHETLIKDSIQPPPTTNHNSEQPEDRKQDRDGLEEEYAKLNTKKQELENENVELKKKNENLDNEYAKLKTENENLVKETRELENEIQATNKSGLWNFITNILNTDKTFELINLQKKCQDLEAKYEEEKRNLQQYYETTHVYIEQNLQISTNSNVSNPKQKSQTKNVTSSKNPQDSTNSNNSNFNHQYSTSSNNSNSNHQYSTNYSNCNQKYKDLETKNKALEEDKRSLQLCNQKLESKCKTLESECKTFESKFNDQKKLIEELTKSSIELTKTRDNLKKETKKYQSALGNATSFHLGNQDSDRAGQLSVDILNLHKMLENFCGLKKVAKINEPEIDELLNKYGFQNYSITKPKKILISGLLERYVIEAIIEKYNEYLKLQDHDRDTDQDGQNLEMKIINTTEQLLGLTKSFSEYRSGTDTVSKVISTKLRQQIYGVLGNRGFSEIRNKEHPLILKLRSEIIDLMNRFRTISDKKQLSDNEAMINPIIRQVINIFLFRLKVQEPVADWKFFDKNTSINTIMMSAPWNNDDLENTYVDVCAFPVIGSNLCEANQVDKNMKVIVQAQVIATS